jgi:hypothetical protein
MFKSTCNGRGTVKRKEIEVAERLLAGSFSKLSWEQPAGQRPQNGMILRLAQLPDVEVDVLPKDHSVQLRPSGH